MSEFKWINDSEWVGDYLIVKDTIGLLNGRTVYEVRLPKIRGLCCGGCYIVADFDNLEDARLYAEEQQYLYELEIENAKKHKSVNQEKKYIPKPFTSDWITPCGVGEITSAWDERR